MSREASEAMHDHAAACRICFVCKHAHPLFDPSDPAPIGGAETHAYTLARALADRGDLQVSFLLEAPRRDRSWLAGGIRIVNSGDGFDRWRNSVAQCIEMSSAFPWLRVRQWQWPLLWQVPVLAARRPLRPRGLDPRTPSQTIADIAADAYCCFGVSAYSANAIATARADSRRSLLFLMSNDDLNPQFQPQADFVTPYGERGDVCRYVIDQADLIIAQHELQQRHLRERFDRDSTILPNPIDLEEWDRLAAASSPSLDRLAVDRFVLWIGRADRFHKRPQLALQLAEQLPDVRFLMLLNPRDRDVARQITGNHPPNVTIVESVPFTEMPSLFARAAAYVSTGSADYEGAPNVFIQSAASSVPIVSLEVSAPVILEGGGFVADGDLHRLAQRLREYWTNQDTARAIGAQGRAFAEQHHISSAIAERLLQIVRHESSR